MYKVGRLFQLLSLSSVRGRLTPTAIETIVYTHTEPFTRRGSSPSLGEESIFRVIIKKRVCPPLLL